MLISFCLHYISLSHINVFRVFQSVCLPIASTAIMDWWHERRPRLRMLRWDYASVPFHWVDRRWLCLLNVLLCCTTRIQVRNVGVRGRCRRIVMLLMLLAPRVYTWPTRLLLWVQWWTAHWLCCRLIDVLLLNEVEVFRDHLWIVKFVVEFPVLILLHVHILNLFDWVALVKFLYSVLEVVKAQYHNSYVV